MSGSGLPPASWHPTHPSTRRASRANYPSVPALGEQGGQRASRARPSAAISCPTRLSAACVLWFISQTTAACKPHHYKDQASCRGGRFLRDIG